MKNLFVVIAALCFTVLVSCSNEKPEDVREVGCKSQLSENCEGYMLSVNDIEMYFEIHGEGEPLLLIHGGTGFIESFAPQLMALSQHYRVIAADSRGHGRTTDSDQPLSYSLMATDKVALLNHLEIEKAHIVGWSDGGIIGLELAINHSEYVNKVAIIGSNYHEDGLVPEIVEAWMQVPADEWYPEVVEFYRANAENPDHWPVFLDKVRAMWSTLPVYEENELKNIKAEFLVMAGENEELILESHTRKMADLIPNATLLIIPDGTHFVPLEKPDEVNGALLNFLIED